MESKLMGIGIVLVFIAIVMTGCAHNPKSLYDYNKEQLHKHHLDYLFVGE